MSEYFDEQTQWALSRILEGVPEERLPASLIIIDNKRIRIRGGRDA
ncbi:MAG: hypothetical protein HY675_04350 [Chloroflexi bacterium]|nr:hypothetical protein [Chloroflexota bacterium]